METEIDDDIGITGKELSQIVAEQKCSVGVMTSLKKLVGSFANPKMFLSASDAELRRRGRCGARILELVAAIKERCFFLEKNKEERFRYNRSFAKYMDERDRRQAKEIERLNPVFTANDLQAAALYMGEEKVEFIDLRQLNEFRHAMTAAQRDEMRRRHREQEEERARREAEELARREKERNEREAKGKKKGGGNGAS